MLSYSENLEFISISCTEPVKFNQIEPGDIQISISGPLAPYEFEFNVNTSTGFEIGKISETFGIHLNFKSSLYGNNQGNLVINSFSKSC